MPSFDAIIIGTGQAGPSLARRLAGAGQRVAIIERNRFGGTCINTGCTPTKALVASAYVAHTARRAAEYGVTIGGDVRVDMRRVKARMDDIRGTSRHAVERSLRNTAGVTVIEGHAQFASSRAVHVGDETLAAERIFINVGARPATPPIPGLASVPFLTSSTILELDAVPAHLVVIGGSYVALEFAQMYRRFGAAVTVIEHADRLTAREDPEISEAIRAILAAEGIAIRLGAEKLAVAAESGGIAVTFDGRRVQGSHLLLAAGRRPNTDDLDLDRAGVATDSHGAIEVDDRLETNVPNIWALGECNGRGAFTHTSYDDGEIVGANLLSGESRSVRDRITAYATFIDPPLGRAGLTEAEAQAQAQGRPILVARMNMEDVSRAYEKGETQGLMKVVVDRDTERILGAAILGTGGDEAVHCILDTMYAGGSYRLLQRAVHIHPTVAEFIPTLLADLAPP